MMTRSGYRLLIAALLTALACLGCDEEAPNTTLDQSGGDSTTDDVGDTNGVDTSGDDTDPGDTSGDDTGGDDTGGGDATSDDTSGGGDTTSDTSGDDTSCAVDRQCGGACCNTGEFCIFNSCTDTCVSGVTCGPTDGLCCPTGQSCLEDGTCGIDCEDGRDACGTTDFNKVCCDAGQVCLSGTCQKDCGDNVLCDGVCCDAGQQCLNDACVADCPSEARLCGENLELCCGEGEVCFNNACAEPGETCALTEQCGVDEYCELALDPDPSDGTPEGKCLARASGTVCEFRPPVGEFSPQQACRWTPPSGDTYANKNDVVMAPVVANLNDDNGDGLVNTLDIPDIAFISFDRGVDGCCSGRGILRIVSGACNPDGTMNTHFSSDGSPWMDSSGGLAIGDIAGDSTPEIVGVFGGRDVSGAAGTIAWHRVVDGDGNETWEILWRNNNYIPAARIPDGGTQPSLADLDADGAPEVIVGNVALNAIDGTLKWDGAVDAAAQSISQPGIGNNAFLGPVSTVADIDLDGKMEVIAGNTVYNGEDGTVQWHYDYTSSNSGCRGTAYGIDYCDGFSAVGNFDGDPEAEVVIVRQGEVFLLDHRGDFVNKLAIPNIDCGGNESGPPTVADFDGDGRAEIATASSDYYVVVDWDCTTANRGTPNCDTAAQDPRDGSTLPDYILWRQRNQDCSSRATGSSVFDFEGDGKAEVVYADEQTFYIFDGTNGDILYRDDSHNSNTRLEMPIVVDVDNDGKSEVIIPEPSSGGNGTVGGIDVIEDADNNWVRTRRIWNQHTYHVTNISEDGQIPVYEEPNWTNGRLNNFRQNIQPGGLFDAPDLVIDDLNVDRSGCGGGSLSVTVTISNKGLVGVPPGILVTLWFRVTGGDLTLIETRPTTQNILPGTTETLTFTFSPPAHGSNTFTLEVSVDDDGTGAGQYNECVEDNNDASSAEQDPCRSN